MILELNNGEIKVKKNTIEKIEHALIYLEVKDMVVTNSDIVTLFINDKKVNKINNTTFDISFSNILENENKLSVTIMRGNTLNTYSTNVEIKKYFSLGDLPYNKHPQIIIDIFNEIEKLKKEIQELKNKGTVI